MEPTQHGDTQVKEKMFEISTDTNCYKL